MRVANPEDNLRHVVEPFPAAGPTAGCLRPLAGGAEGVPAPAEAPQDGGGQQGDEWLGGRGDGHCQGLRHLLHLQG